MLRREINPPESAQKEESKANYRNWSENNPVAAQLFESIRINERLASVNDGAEETKTIVEYFYREYLSFIGRHPVDKSIEVHLRESLVYPWELINMTEEEIQNIEGISPEAAARIKKVFSL